MTDNEIIKALECCVQYTTTDVRTYKGMPLEVFSQAVLDLINRQKAEIERLHSENEILSKNAAEAFQEGLNENRKLFTEEILKEFAHFLIDRAEGGGNSHL